MSLKVILKTSKLFPSFWARWLVNYEKKTHQLSTSFNDDRYEKKL